MLLVTVALVMVQEMAVRLGAHTGKGLAALIREQFSLRLAGSRSAAWCSRTPAWSSASSPASAPRSSCSASRARSAIPPAAALLWALVVFGSYKRAQRVFLLVSLAFLAYPIAMVLGHPRWGQVGSHLVVPHLHASSAFLLLGVALIGTTVSPYMQFYAAAGVVDRQSTGTSPSLRLLRVDAIVGAVFACVISVTIIVATGTAIGGTGPLHSAAQAALALKPAAGSARDRALRDRADRRVGPGRRRGAAVDQLRGRRDDRRRAVGGKRFSQAPLFLGLFTAQIVLGAPIAMTPVNVISLLIGSQVLQGLISPVILVFILVLANRRSCWARRRIRAATGSPPAPWSPASA